MGVEVRLLAPLVEVERWLATQSHIHLTSEIRHGVLLRFELDEAQKTKEREVLSDALQSMQLNNLKPYEFHRQEQKLEDAFINMLRVQPPPITGGKRITKD